MHENDYSAAAHFEELFSFLETIISIGHVSDPLRKNYRDVLSSGLSSMVVASIVMFKY